MKKLKSKLIFAKLISYGVILLALIFAGTLSFVLSKNIATTKPQVKEAKKVSVVKKSDISPTALPDNEIKNQDNKPNNSGIADDKTSYTVVTTTAPIPTTYS
ncbi:MAG TPA: hypothetical protein VLG67_05555, partial [Candidatus Saccharimonadales bacterium]|nr:hypothetical protein [Candidatus Saccharimonadales bacterium]